MPATRPETVKRARKDTLETRRQMIDAAEALFAEHGIDNVTLLDIARAAGQKNRNAPQYHFGDKVGLINAVLDKHADQISHRRAQMMAELENEESPDMGNLVDAFVLPVAEHVDSTENSLAYLLINAQLMTSMPYRETYLQRVNQLPEVRQLMVLMQEAMPGVSPQQNRARMLLIQGMLFHGLASFYASGPASGSRVFIETLRSSIEAVLRQSSTS